MGQGVKRTQRDYSLTFKLALVEQIEKGELTYKLAQVRYGIQSRSTVLVWLRKHGRQDWSQRGLLCVPAGASPCQTPTTRRPNSASRNSSSSWR